MKIDRRYTTESEGAYGDIAFVTTTSEIRNPDGTVVDEGDPALRVQLARETAAIALAKSAQLLPAVLLVALAEPPQGLVQLAPGPVLDQLAAESRLAPVAAARLPITAAEHTRLHILRAEDGGSEHYAVEIGDPPRDAPVLARLRGHLLDLDVFGLTALHDLVTIPGSLILGLAVIEGRIDGAEAHRLSRIDEDFQAERWGADEEAAEAAEGRRLSILSAERLWSLSRRG